MSRVFPGVRGAPDTLPVGVRRQAWPLVKQEFKRMRRAMLARRLHGYLRWHNASARHPDVLAAQPRTSLQPRRTPATLGPSSAEDRVNPASVRAHHTGDTDDIALAQAAAAQGINISPLTPLHLAPSRHRGLLAGSGRLTEHKTRPPSRRQRPCSPRPEHCRQPDHRSSNSVRSTPPR